MRSACSSSTSCNYRVEHKFKLDDALGAITVHGYTGFYGCVVAGFLLWGYPSSPHEGYAAINPLGNFIGAVIMFLVLGYMPGYIAAKVLDALGMLRLPKQVELAGLDIAFDYARDVDEQAVEAAELEETEASGLVEVSAGTN